MTDKVFAIVDLETTGGSPVIDRVVEIAIVTIYKNEIIDRYVTLVNPERPIDKYVSDITGITDEMVKDKPRFTEIADTVMEKLQDKIFVAHNVRFDYGMFRQEFKRMGIDFTAKKVDTISLARYCWKDLKSLSLGNLCKYLDIEIKDRHRALGDAEATSILFNKIMNHPEGEKFLALELNQGIDHTLLPEKISADIIFKLPEEPGVLIVRDASNAILYVEGGNSGIKLLSRFIAKFHKGEPELYQRAFEMEFELSGSELLAKLLAVKYRVQEKPPMNALIKENNYHWGLYTERNSFGIDQLKIQKLDNKLADPDLKFSSKPIAAKVLSRILKDAQYFILINLYNQSTEESHKVSIVESINQKLQQALKNYMYQRSDFAILQKGIGPQDVAYIVIEHNAIKGFKMLTNPSSTISWEDVNMGLTMLPDNRETQKYIRQLLKPKSKIKMILPGKKQM